MNYYADYYFLYKNAGIWDWFGKQLGKLTGLFRRAPSGRPVTTQVGKQTATQLELPLFDQAATQAAKQTAAQGAKQTAAQGAKQTAAQGAKQTASQAAAESSWLGNWHNKYMNWIGKSVLRGHLQNYGKYINPLVGYGVPTLLAGGGAYGLYRALSPSRNPSTAIVTYGPGVKLSSMDSIPVAMSGPGFGLPIEPTREEIFGAATTALTPIAAGSTMGALASLIGGKARSPWVWLPTLAGMGLGGWLGYSELKDIAERINARRRLKAALMSDYYGAIPGRLQRDVISSK